MTVPFARHCSANDADAATVRNAVGHDCGVAGAGAVVGSGLAALLGRSASSLLFQVSSVDAD
jgi:hypothetical protein